MRVLSKVFLLTGIIWVCATGHAAVAISDVYVHPTLGLDTNSGSKEKPLKTISAAMSLLPDVIQQHIVIHLGAGEYNTTGGIDMPENNLILDRQMHRTSASVFDVSVTFAGENDSFTRPADRGQVILNWPFTPLIVAKNGIWKFQNLQIGNRNYPGSQEGIRVLGTGSEVHLKDVRIRTGSLSGSGICASRGGVVLLYGTIEMNEDLHNRQMEASFCGIMADYGGIVKWQDSNGNLSMGNGSLSTSYFGIIELGCKKVMITSWGGQSNCLAINNSGRIDMHGTEITLTARMQSNAVIGLEDDGHILAEGAQMIVETQSDFPASIVLQKSSTLYGGPITVAGPGKCSIYTMSGSNLVSGVIGEIQDLSADTGSYLNVYHKGSVGNISQSRGGIVVAEPF